MKNITQTPTILITGATGTVGSELAKQLSLRGIRFKTLVRSPQKASMLQSIKEAELVTGDFNDMASIEQALIGIDKVFLLTNSTELAERQQISFVEAAKSSGVKHIVKLSQFAADINSPVRFLRYHAAVEQRIIDSGIAYTFLRPNLFMQGLLGFKDPIANLGQFFAPASQARISLIDIGDIAATAAIALTEWGHEHKIYNLTGPEALTHGDIAQHISDATGNSVQYIDVSPDEMRNALLSIGFPEWQTEGLLEDYAHYVRGEAAIISPDVQEVTGVSPRNFKSFARDFAKLFGA